MSYQVMSLKPIKDFAIGRILFENEFKPEPHLYIKILYPFSNSKIIAIVVMKYEFVNPELNFEALFSQDFSVTKNDELNLSSYSETVYNCYLTLMQQFSSYLDDQCRANELPLSKKPRINTFEEFRGIGNASPN